VGVVKGHATRENVVRNEAAEEADIRAALALPAH
jgi:hypothetical protein